MLMSREPLTCSSLNLRQRILCAGALTCLGLQALNAQNLVTNPGFENGTTGWFGGQLTTTSVGAFSGSASGAATVGAYTTAAGQTMLGKLERGQTYTWSAWLKAASGSATITMYLNQTDSAGSRATALSTKTVTTIWTQYSTTFSLVVTGALTDLSVTFTAANTPLTLFLDDVSITNSSPVLGLVLTNQLISLSWPATATHYTLHTATNLVAPVNWVAVTNAAQSNAALFLVTLPATNAAGFFRLQQP